MLSGGPSPSRGPRCPFNSGLSGPVSHLKSCAVWAGSTPSVIFTGGQWEPLHFFGMKAEYCSAQGTRHLLSLHTLETVSRPATCSVPAAGPGAAGALGPGLGTVLRAAMGAQQPAQAAHTDGAPAGRSAGAYLLPLLPGAGAATGAHGPLLAWCLDWKPGLCRAAWTLRSLEPDPAPH